ncbi:YbjN domain-containing protein [Nannocystis bainbridge]|uniref:YbjN domain-containing protein n=1 Tax=Nannocystis bainbridge TaxID=2995303 RepID=A0ABT5E4I5_9BACT|nr:YbjN domain-containing protein [Nannocystis bainbridge]MDC0720772.1 YbjN domain-containing protein [Nannocystis bainbridge]
MSHAETLESYMLRMELPHEKVSDDTWVVGPESHSGIRIVVRIDEPIVLYSSPIFAVTAATPDHTGLFRRLLEFNDTTLHCAYALDGDQILLSGAHQLADLDFSEFQAMIEDIAMAIDGHLEQLSPWRPAPTHIEIQEGN